MCDRRVYGYDSFVCVCDMDYCDVTGDVSLPPKGHFKRVISSRDEHRFKIKTEKVTGIPNEESITLIVDYDQEFQEIIGFGGAFSDAAGIAIRSLSPPTQQNLLRSYFSQDGIEYNLCRIPIAGTDFSTRPYSYDDVEKDISLKHFSLTSEDFLYKIPIIKEVLAISNKNIRFFASPWSPPAWMKENNKLNGKGGLLKSMWDSYSDYLIKFVREYKKHGIDLWGITTVNEPLAGFQDWSWNACAWSSTDMKDWIKLSFGPKLKASEFSDLKVLVYEHGRKKVLAYVSEILNDEECSKYVDGIALHWYDDFEENPKILKELQEKFKNKFLLYTEACTGFDQSPSEKVQLGSWKRAEYYAENIIDDMNNNVTGWVDWNIALDIKGGPNWVENYVDSPIIVNESKDEFYKQPMFYALGHFSKFVKQGYKVLHTSSPTEDIKLAAFKRRHLSSYVVIILNKSHETKTINLKIFSSQFINITLDPKSLETILFIRSP